MPAPKGGGQDGPLPGPAGPADHGVPFGRWFGRAGAGLESDMDKAGGTKA